MEPVTSWAAAVASVWAARCVIVRRPWPRRFPDDDAEVPLGAAGRGPDTGDPRVPPRRAERRGRIHRSRVGRGDAASDLTDLAASCDLLAVAVTAGCTVSEAVAAVGEVGEGPVGRALGAAADDIARGRGLLDALGGLRSTLGPSGHPLATTLATAATSGAPLAPSLLRLADGARRRSRRRVEARVRRLPVLLLLPLVVFVLPAFVLLTLVPVGLSAVPATGLAGSPPPASPFPLLSNTGGPR